MSRRKQTKPQQLRCEDEDEEAPCRTGLEQDGCLSSPSDFNCGDVGPAVETRAGCSEETHICANCCAQFFTWTELRNHRASCIKDPMVLIVKESLPEDSPSEESPGEESTGEPSLVFSVATSDSSAAESIDATVDNDSLYNLEGREGNEGMEPKASPEMTSNPPLLDSTESTSTQTVSVPDSYKMPSTNVTLEILHSTRVAVAQFSQRFKSNCVGGKAAAAALPLILEHLLALQQQQFQQLQLIEQICSQVAVMNRLPTQAAIKTASRSVALASNIPPIRPLSETTPSSINGQSLRPGHEKPQSAPLKTFCDQSIFTSVSPENPTSPASSLYCSRTVSTLLPPYMGSNSISSLSESLALPLPGILSSSSSLPVSPQSSPIGVIFPNPLGSVAATANTLDPLAAQMKHRKGKLPNMSLLESKSIPEEPLFKHKCRFCAKVFGSDSALQIHLRSHTGERPFKCNICGNRFSTKGNLKVHFQRHKEKYPHVQMNPFPVPEYLDIVPTSSGIPYGMSVPPEKPVSSWLDSKPVVATLPTSVALRLSPIVSVGSNDAVNLPTSLRSLYQTAPAECVSDPPNHPGSEGGSPSASETKASKILKTDDSQLPQSCTPSMIVDPVIDTPSRAITSASLAGSSPPILHPTDSVQTSETSKLQQLVQNIDKKITDHNECILCHRVLSCQRALRMHYLIHSGERPFKCKLCGRAFTTRGNLKTHVAVHRENPPVQVKHSCPVCQKFTNAVALQQHIHLHMDGQISNSDVMQRLQDTDESPSSNGNELSDNISMEDEEEEEDFEIEDDVNPHETFMFDCRSYPKSGVGALQNQMMTADTSEGLNHCFIVKPLLDRLRGSSLLSIDGVLTGKAVENCLHVSEPSCSPHAPTSSLQRESEGRTVEPLKADTKKLELQEPLNTSVKSEQPQSPSSAPASSGNPSKIWVKEESPYSMSFQLSRDRAADQSITGLLTSSSSSSIRTEMTVQGQVTATTNGQQPPLNVHISATYPTIGSPGGAPLLGPPHSRRTPKQHNCNACGKNFSSASALQIHERTHTGEKPFVCSVCGRAFTTKGNLKVHMGTHMWTNTPARRGRRLGGEALKFGEVFHNDLTTGGVNLESGFWSRCATAITNSLAMKTSEMSMIQERSISQLYPLSVIGSPTDSKTGLNKTFFYADR